MIEKLQNSNNMKKKMLRSAKIIYKTYIKRFNSKI